MIRTSLIGIELHAARVQENVAGRGAPWNGHELARRIGVSRAFLHNWEAGQRTPPPDYVASALGALGVTGEHRARVISLVQHPDTDPILLGRRHRPWHIATADVCALMSKRIIDWHPLLVPDLLRTQDYANAIARDVLPETVIPEQDRAFTVEAAAREHKIDAMFYVGEHAIQNPIGGREVTMAQLLHLLKLIQTTPGKLAIRVVPASRGAHAGLAGPFTVFNTPAGRIVHRNHGYCGSFSLANEDDSPYSADAQLSTYALSANESSAFIAEQVKRYAEEERFGKQQQLTS